MNDTQKSITWDELLSSIETAAAHPADTAWTIYRYLSTNYRQIGSQQARMLLAAYMRLPVERPSLVHSCILGVALKVSDQYSDFRFPQFLELWGYEHNLRPEDRQRQKGRDGRTYHSLLEKTEQMRRSYALRHHIEAPNSQGSILKMYAVKVFEREASGRKRRFVKLVGARGEELTADCSIFPCRAYEIQGRLFDVLTRTSQQGNLRAAEIVLSDNRVEEVFPPTVGYVDGIDESRGHYHVYDALSRHFVAERPRMPIERGCFVEFSPIVPGEDKFKSAAIIRVLGHEEGLAQFGILEAEVTYMNRADGYLRYRLLAAPPVTDEGIVSPEGFASLLSLRAEARLEHLSVGHTVGLVLFLKRGNDGEKRNHVVEII